MLPAVLAVPAAWAEEVAEQAQQAVEQGKQVAEQAQQQFKLPSDLQYPSGSGLKIPKELPSTSGLEEFISQNPAIIAAGVAVVGVGLVIAKLVGKGVNVKKLSAAKAFDLLSNESDIIFVDLRSKQEVNEAGSPDLRSITRKITSLPYTVGLAGDLVEGFSDKLLKLPNLTEDSEVLFFDSYGPDAKAVAGAVREGVKQVYWVADGADGVRGWKASQLPWREPSRGFNFDLSGLTNAVNIDKLAEDFKAQPTLTKAGLAVGAVGAAAVLLFNEVEIVLEVLGVAAAGNFLAKKLLFAKDREQTVEQIRDIVDNKIAAGEVGKDLKRVADTLVETVTETEQVVDKNVSPEIKDTYRSVQKSSQKAVAWGKDKVNSLESDAGSVSKDVQKSAEKTGNKVQSQAESVTDKSKDIGKDIKSEAKSASKDVQKRADRTGKEVQNQADSVQDKGKEAGKDIKSEAKSAGKDVEKQTESVKDKSKEAGKDLKSGVKSASKDAEKAADKTAAQAEKTADNAQGKTEELTSKGKQAGQDVKSQVSSAGKEAQQASDNASSKAQSGAQEAKSKMDGAGQSTKDKFEKQKEEVLDESKENIKEAESTLQNKQASSNGSSSAPEVPSQQDVKQQAQEARGWIEAWRKKQPVKANA